jgi:hypothetical protein
LLKSILLLAFLLSRRSFFAVVHVAAGIPALIFNLSVAGVLDVPGLSYSFAVVDILAGVDFHDGAGILAVATFFCWLSCCGTTVIGALAVSSVLAVACIPGIGIDLAGSDITAITSVAAVAGVHACCFWCPFCCWSSFCF